MSCSKFRQSLMVMVMFIHFSIQLVFLKNGKFHLHWVSVPIKESHVNYLAVPRKAKEAIGGITKLTHKDGRSMVINETGYSPFPGNIN
ncbi:UDP-sugar pyrophosphorylase 1-like [Salvia splendens]|uniref:UDP-sugar pyrophosphorylase 1-like n=1 Tax=Salvia splendens TaxID=180675 RepID=UPI001C259E60|nr:UDP-sugar pyrophosphorylase 1-like [Salvia splendens]XP_042055581.1 UDP-sugar pyrophosphorylase 1-like [Salvia splendens]